MPAHEYQKETAFLREVIAYDDFTPAGPEAARLDAGRSSGPWRVTYE